MATATFDPRESRLDRYFFPGLALLMLATVFWGFARSYFLAGVFKAPLPNWLIHLHGGRVYFVDSAVDRADFFGGGESRGRASQAGAGGIRAGVPDGRSRYFSVHGLLAKILRRRGYLRSRDECENVLHHSAHRHVDLWDARVSGVPGEIQSSGAQAADSGGHHSANGGGGGPLADCVYPAPSVVGGRVVHVWIPGAVAGVRRVQHGKGASRDDLG